MDCDQMNQLIVNQLLLEVKSSEKLLTGQFGHRNVFDRRHSSDSGCRVGHNVRISQLFVEPS